MGAQSPGYQMHTQVPAEHHRVRHLVALVGVPLAVLGVALVLWTTLKEQCAALSTAQCLPVGPVALGGTEVVVLATILAAGLAVIVEVLAD